MSRSLYHFFNDPSMALILDAFLSSICRFMIFLLLPSDISVLDQTKPGLRWFLVALFSFGILWLSSRWSESLSLLAPRTVWCVPQCLWLFFDPALVCRSGIVFGRAAARRHSIYFFRHPRYTLTKAHFLINWYLTDLLYCVTWSWSAVVLYRPLPFIAG